MNITDYLWGIFLGVIAAVAHCLGILLFRRKGGWLLLLLPSFLVFLPALMVVAVALLVRGSISIYLAGCIIGGSGVGYALAQWVKAAKT